ncbi:ABC transporter ATP-binding protein [Bradyrhizobium sp. U87765 SZCCT0131]|uniref:ABC transporter ATP-binding protein n=1 Tax=unclassified Bradyrhizobium TaxID=2631580 RepID=UPI001BA77C29|nr:MULTISPECIES: ABC transporter ATP-binding protein [unclassified Bradyrhizobium]MBR1217621.1 ABC transporter ATP-binding protein [Bradyrhizobium sp. U87765 SZCCT0131]MBR1261433.1 ABC transporter ATP-binding protein [Bradyrhizobium sp. U87765 SZCCT0134]MBR1303119.1 ABC transporter ATP-binding protein [Bradyrhizobium sp. U87765 SZCCT0110]MBR1318725.1 ABC transporter ATP-binding protein [Bradyrhizobium sp. U87765 SZCCT0109]MBR1347050.1 ABC transporter ATP-binding protein [Bradyrhizobium sp. U87
MTDPVLDVADLRAGYGRVPVLLGVTFAVEAGEIVGILGHNGMGKTTLLKTVVGLVPVTGGRITVAGDDVTMQPVHRRVRQRIGYVPQGREIFGKLTVRENLLLAARVAGLPPQPAVAVAVRDFPMLEELLERKGGALSGGQQQVLALARALCGKPDLLLLDEPTEGIQPSIVEEMEGHLLRLAAGGLGIVVVEQDLDFIASVAGRVLMLQKGAIVREVAPSALRDPAMIDAFMGIRP